MMRDTMAVISCAFDECGLSLSIVADDKKGRLYTFFCKRIEKFGCWRGGSIIKGQHNFMIIKRKGAWVALQANSRSLRAAYCQNAVNAKRLRAALRMRQTR